MGMHIHDNGTVDLTWGRRVLIPQATARLVYRTGDGQGGVITMRDGPPRIERSDRRTRLTLAKDKLLVTWDIVEGAVPLLAVQVHNVGQEPIYLDEIDVLAAETVNLGVPLHEVVQYYQGWQSWSVAGIRRHRTIVGPVDEDALRKHFPHGPDPSTSEWASVLIGHHALLLGFITARDHLCAIHWPEDGRLRAVCYADGIPLAPGAGWTSETLALMPAASPEGLLERYGRLLGQRMEARVPRGPAPTGWCTWYYFYGENTEDDVLANAQRIRELGLPLEVILIDDGYQAAMGDWLLTNKRFPHGMAWLAEQLRQLGFRPGIWLAPFGVEHTSRLFAEHPEWVLRQDGREVEAWRHAGIEDPIMALDTTHPAALEWVTETFRTLCAWGYDFFKIDFCFAAALSGDHHQSATRAQALRRGLQAIRTAVGDRFILGCGMPLGPAVGLIDAKRIGPDVFINWKPIWPDDTAPATSNSLRNALTRWWCHRRLWLNDPDCVLVRRRGDENNLTLPETQTLVSVVGLSGGVLMDSDHLPTLTDDRLAYLLRLLPPWNGAGRPVDVFTHERPQVVHLPVTMAWGTWDVLALINWTDRTTTTTVDVPTVLGRPARTYHAVELWSGQYLGRVRQRLDITRHRPHSTLLVVLKPVSRRPDFLASTFHVTGGACEISEVRFSRNALHITVERPVPADGTLILTVPPPYRLAGVRVNGRPHAWRSLAHDIIAIRLRMERQAHVDVEVAR